MHITEDMIYTAVHVKGHPWSTTPKRLDIQFSLKLCNTGALKGMYLRMANGTKRAKITDR